MESEQSLGLSETENAPPRRGMPELVEKHLSSLSLKQDESGSEDIPKGPTYSLNSKRVTAVHLQQIATFLGLPTRGTAAVTR